MTRPQLLRNCASCLVGGLLLVGAAGCQKTTGSGSAAGDASAYGVLTAQTGGASQTAPSSSGTSYSNGNSGGNSGYAQPVSELAPTPPPPLPTYDQPPPPADGDIWTPGYWAWNTSDEDYYWAPGTWVEPPREGVYWTPGYWRYLANAYGFVPGYWGPTVGFYGGVNYGWGYGGQGYEGGRWQNNHFYYNQAANNLGDRHFGGVYSEPVHSFTSGRASFNGGPHGVDVRVPPPVNGQRVERIPPTPAQREQVRVAFAQPGLRASVNHGAPPIVATTRPGQLRGPGVVTVVKSAPHYDPPAREDHGPAPRPATIPTRAETPAGRPAPAPERATPPDRAAPERAAPEARPAPEYHAAPQAQHTAPPMAREAPRAAAPPPRPVEARHPVAAAPRPAPPPPHPAAPPPPHPPEADKPHH
jgi:hypothetical protein